MRLYEGIVQISNGNFVQASFIESRRKWVSYNPKARTVYTVDNPNMLMGKVKEYKTAAALKAVITKSKRKVEENLEY